MKVLVTGVGGQLGFDVCRELDRRGIEYVGADIEDFDITDFDASSDFIKKCSPDVVIHCSAWTAVDKAEEQPEKAFQVNVDGTRNIALICRETDAKMIYISTDYVFAGDGEGFYAPEEPVGPLGVYGATKLCGELAVKAFLEKYFIVRTSWVFGENGSNFVKTMIKLSETHGEINVVSDQIGSPTYTVDLAKLLCDMAGTDKYGVYHATNEGICSWAEFAEEIFKIIGRNIKVNRILTDEYRAKANRPRNSRLNKDKLEKMGFARLPDWHDALCRYLADLKQI